MQRTTRRAVFVAILAIGLLALPACLTENAAGVPDPGAPLHHDFGLSGNCGLVCGVPVSCYTVSGGPNGRNALCRVVEGIEEVGDHRNWDVTVSCTWSGSWCYWDDTEVHADGIFDPNAVYGVQIRTGGGAMYEGCRFRFQDIDGTSNAVFWCDYRIPGNRELIIDTQGGARWVLHTLWDWGLYSAKALGGCTAAIYASWISGAGLGAVALACNDGPY